ncbi:anaerobic ribonucleoside-triphosphate reductase activating protein [Capnocytophaga cynodegmi]|uniref:Anaerobic ribonucleoside-triphosphate reductase activating protein n=1 Tax=Capnocytophaga cynodegmi TaxID=28189 RepID=A0A250E5D4_9FLAO|nr:anaerobic ribonucleoside-triphosphate reductase activating protein [Capnocytophaga cynodegmi]ATA68134.1 anaerobic ribonucleoside-triphosphate reductase activating protein [Capnocytophaga cynodegmi]
MAILRYSEYDIVLQEVPNEISLCFTITGCPLACEGCHSEHIWNPNFGQPLTLSLLEKLIEKYEGTISCVLFMGGEWNIDQLLNFITIAKEKNLKTALYTGLNIKQVARKYPQLLERLDYIKTGKWIPSLGGLDSKITNQHLLEIKTGKILNHFFWKE